MPVDERTTIYNDLPSTKSEEIARVFRQQTFDVRWLIVANSSGYSPISQSELIGDSMHVTLIS